MEDLLDQLEINLAEVESSLAWCRVRCEKNRTQYVRIENLAATSVEVLTYRPAVFIVLKLTKSDTCVETRFLTYNEESIECREFSLASERDLARIQKYMIDRLVRMGFVGCPGVGEERLLGMKNAAASAAELAAVTLAEKVGNSICYRSRHCARIRTLSGSEGAGDLCYPCQAWLRATDTGTRESDSVEMDQMGVSQIERPDLVLSPNPLRMEDAVDGDTGGFSDVEGACDEVDAGSTYYSEEENKRTIPITKSRGRKKDQPNGRKSTRIGQKKVGRKRGRKKKKLIKDDEDGTGTLGTGTASGDNGAAFPCPFQTCAKQFRISLGKNMLKHLEQHHNCTLPSAHQQLEEQQQEQLPEEVRSALAALKEEAALLLATRKSKVYGRRYYPCTQPNCDYVARDVTALRYHQPVHTGEMQFCCPVCGKSFRYKKELMTCEKRHRGELAFLCEHCDKKFICKKKLDLHVRVHTGEKPFFCPLCSFRCSRQDNLNTHIKKHHGLSWRDAERMTGISHKTGRPLDGTAGVPTNSSEAHSVVVEQDPLRIPQINMDVEVKLDNAVGTTESVIVSGAWL